MINERTNAFQPPAPTRALGEVAIHLHPADQVAVLKCSLPADTELACKGTIVRLRCAIPAGHKVAVAAVAEGAPIRKYGQTIGFARGEIAPGDHVHVHNVEVRDFARHYEFGTEVRPPAPPRQERTFLGYARAGGRVGTRNYLAIISSVNCSASVAQYVKARFPIDSLRQDYPNVDGVIAFTHKSGCCVQPGEPYVMLQRVLAGLARHPNIFGYVMVGLGCEGHQIDRLRQDQGLDRLLTGESAPVFFNIQAQGGVRKTVEAAATAVQRLLPRANAVGRTVQPLSKLVLALNCGGSDGASGITANPALGVASDELVRHGGTSVLAETPEIYGAEHLLTRRAVSRAVGERLLERIRWWEQHVRTHGATIDNNPSPGNKAGGLTTIYEKSLGALAKGGSAPLSAVYEYAEPITAPGLAFMDTPGFDPVSMTGLVCGGCNLGLFTTGRGSVYGCKPTPCLKVAANTALFTWMHEDMDLNAGTILDGDETVEQMGLRLFEEMLAVAGGKPTKSELQGIGDEEFAPWILGPTF
jgi:altronate hydrolase